MKLDGTIYVGRDDSIPETLRGLFALAEDPREVQVVVGSREILVTPRLLDAWTASREGQDAETSVAEPEQEEVLLGVPGPAEEEPAAAPAEEAPAEEETTAPRQRRPRKAAPPAAEETA